MIFYKNNKNLSSNFLNKIFFFFKKKYFLVFQFIIYTIFLFYLGKSFSYDIKNSYSFSELFLNYEGGFVRRGFLGQLFLFLYEYFEISPLLFFSYLLFSFHILNLFFFFELIKNNALPFEIKIIIIFSPALVFFPIYDFNMFFSKDLFIKFLILLHAFIIIKINGDLNSYHKYLKFLIIPLIFFVNIFIHEYGIFFISIHLLLSLYVFKFKNNFLYFIYTTIFLLINLIIFLFIGNEQIYDQINLSVKVFDISVHPQLSGGFKSLIGGFYKWHFFYFNYRDFAMLLFSFLLSTWIFFLIFHNLIKKSIIKYNFNYSYLLFFIPCLGIFLNIDHGRNLSLLSFHLVIFYLILKVDIYRLQKYTNKVRSNFIIINFAYIFIFLYLFMWILPQDAGFGWQGKYNTIFKTSLFGEFVSFFKFLYNLISEHIITLPEIKL